MNLSTSPIASPATAHKALKLSLAAAITPVPSKLTPKSPRKKQPAPQRQAKPPARIQRTWKIHEKQYNKQGHKIGGLERHYPAPIEKLSVEEMLELPPLPGNIGYVEKELKEPRRDVHAKSAERKMADFEETKRKLRAFKAGFDAGN